MVVVNASINDSNSNAFASDAGLVKLIDSGHIMEGIICCEGFLGICLQRLGGRKHDLVGVPCLTDGFSRLKGINILLMGFNGRPSEDITAE